MEQKEKKRLLKVRARISKKRPHFKRFESWRFVRIKDQWRKPRGIDNKMRTELQGWPKSVKSGIVDQKLYVDFIHQEWKR